MRRVCVGLCTRCTVHCAMTSTNGQKQQLWKMKIIVGSSEMTWGRDQTRLRLFQAFILGFRCVSLASTKQWFVASPTISVIRFGCHTLSPFNEWVLWCFARRRRRPTNVWCTSPQFLRFFFPFFATRYATGISTVALCVLWADQKWTWSEVESQRQNRRVILSSRLFCCCCRRHRRRRGFFVLPLFSFYLLRTHLFHSILEYLSFPSPPVPTLSLCTFFSFRLLQRQKSLNSHDPQSRARIFPFDPSVLPRCLVVVVVGTLVCVWNEFIIPARAYENFNAGACVLCVCARVSGERTHTQKHFPHTIHNVDDNINWPRWMAASIRSK